MNEEWKDIAGYEGRYQVSNWGRVKSLDQQWMQKSKHGNLHLHKKKGQLLKPGLTAQGYPSVVLGRADTKLVHSLVAETFIGPRPKNFDVCHIDGTRDNNHLSNLRFGSRSDNNIDASFHGRRKLSLEDLEKIRNHNGTCQEIAKIFGISKGYVSSLKTYKQRDYAIDRYLF